jgi:hypothetical protein
MGSRSAPISTFSSVTKKAWNERLLLISCSPIRLNKCEHIVEINKTKYSTQAHRKKSRNLVLSIVDCRMYWAVHVQLVPVLTTKDWGKRGSGFWDGKMMRLQPRPHFSVAYFISAKVNNLIYFFFVATPARKMVGIYILYVQNRE